MGYLGFEGVGFNGLWPLFAGLVASIILAFRFFIGGGRVHWLAGTLIAAAPISAGFAYLKLLVVGRPPHFKGDLWTTALDLRLDFTDPPFPVLPLVPRVYVDATAAGGPGRAADLVHPMRLRPVAAGQTRQ